MWCLEGDECVARKFKDRDESRWVLQKWEEEVEVGKILHPTQSHAKTTPSSPCALTPPSLHPDGDSNLSAITPANASPTSPPLAMEELADHPNVATGTVPPPPCSNTTPPSQTGMVITRPVCGDDVLMMHHATKRGFKDCPGFLNSTGRLGPKRGRKCYVTPAFSGVPKRRGTKSEVKTYARGHHDAPRNKAWIQRLSRFPQ